MALTVSSMTKNTDSPADAECTQPAPPAAPADPLPALRADFPAFRIWREDVCDRVLYVTRSLHLGLNPYTVVTDDPAELRAALELSREVACTGPGAPSAELQ
jgi:hypothetical protein